VGSLHVRFLPHDARAWSNPLAMANVANTAAIPITDATPSYN
jgi:hypothetical protein